MSSAWEEVVRLSTGVPLDGGSLASGPTIGFTAENSAPRSPATDPSVIPCDLAAIQPFRERHDELP